MRKWLNDQIQSSLLVPEQFRWDFVSTGFAGRPHRDLPFHQDEARVLVCSFWFGIAGTIGDTELRNK